MSIVSVSNVRTLWTISLWQFLSQTHTLGFDCFFIALDCRGQNVREHLSQRMNKLQTDSFIRSDVFNFSVSLFSILKNWYNNTHILDHWSGKKPIIGWGLKRLNRKWIWEGFFSAKPDKSKGDFIKGNRYQINTECIIIISIMHHTWPLAMGALPTFTSRVQLQVNFMFFFSYSQDSPLFLCLV